ncbi:polygalacturonase-like, partial [Macadamia integrifolia]|uniref:polygalacturonase-like n=1 Tax=Macadamia integrifolia TaxID=60698 RepID=UPI001C4FE5A7
LPSKKTLFFFCSSNSHPSLSLSLSLSFVAMNFLLLLLFLLFCSAMSTPTYNVVQLGAKNDGKTDSTKAFQTAWTNACSSHRSAIIYVPQGRYLLKNVYFNGKCNNTHITINIDGTLVAPSNYNEIGNTGTWIMFKSVTGVTIRGGTLDGQGSSLWACKSAGKECPSGASSLGFSNSENIVISGLKSLNSQLFHIFVNGCKNVNFRGVTISAAGDSPNTDGIHVQLSSSVTILGANIKTGDDCISIGPGAANLWIQHISCGPGHGISIGSLGKDNQEQGVQNVTVKAVTFNGTQNGFRIKTWGRASNGFVKGVLFEGGTMKNANNPIVIDQNYCPSKEDCPGKVSGVKISHVTYSNIHGSSASEVAVKFDCSSENPCSDIRLEDVELTYGNQTAQSSCTNAGGTSYGVVNPSSCL